jgi:hypothetical protein
MSDPANLRIQQQINEAIAERGKLLAAQTKQISDQAELAISFCKAMKCDDIDKVAERIQEIRSGLADAAKAAEDQAKATSAAAEATEALRKKREEERDLMVAQNKALAEQEKQVKEMEKSLNKGLKFMTDTFEGAAAGLSALGSLVGSVVTGVFNIGKALLAIPLKIFDVMLNKAADLANASRAVAEAIEDVREQYGDPSGGLAKEVVDGGKEMGKSLGEAGLSISKVFGMGPEGTAAAIREALDIAKSLGPVVGLLGEKFGDAAGDLTVFKKGLGLTNEDMKAVIMQSKAMGKNFRTEFLQMSKIANDMGKKFEGLGISSKDIARDMAYLTTNSGKFGRVTKEAMAAASVTVRSYGLELKDVAGILDQFADFESAATNASKFAQSFGTIIDPIKLMKEENPAKAFEYLREQMLAAGQSAETMNKAQIKQLATLSGMDENSVSLAFSNKNVGKSYEQIQREAEKSGKKQKTQQEIMQDLGKDIKRVVEALQHSGSLLQEFFTGFGEGLARSEKGRKVLYDLASLLKTVRHLGREVGKAFVEAFPGVGTFFDGLHEFLQILKGPGGIESLGVDIKNFFKMLSTDPARATKSLMTFLEGTTGSAGFGKMVKGAREATTAVVGIFAGMIDYIVPKLIEGIETFTKILADPEGIAAGFDKLGSNSKSMFSPLFEAIARNAGPLWESIKKMFEVGWEKYGDDVTSFLGKVVFASLIFGALKAAIIAIPGTIGSFFSGVIVKKLGGEAGESVMKALATRLVRKGGAKVFANTLSKGITAAIGSTGVGLPIAAAIAAAFGASDIDAIVGKTLDEKLASGEIENTAAASGAKIASAILSAITFGLMDDKTYMDATMWMAEKFDSFFNVLSLILGKDFTEALGRVYENVFSFFAGVGDLLMSIFTLDMKRFGVGAGKILASLLGLLFDLDTLLNPLKSIVKHVVTSLGTFLGKLMSSAAEKFGKLVAWIKNFWEKTDFQDFVTSLGKRAVAAGLEVVTNFGNGLKEGFLTVFGRNKKSWLKQFDTKDTLVTQAVADAVTPDASAVLKSVEASSEAIKGETMESIDAIASDVGQYAGLNDEQIKKTQKNLNAGIDNMLKIVAGINGEALKQMRTSIENLDTGALSMFEQLAEKINESIDPSAMSQAIANLKVFDEMLLGNLESVLTRMSSTGNLAKEFGDKYSGDLVAYVEKAADELAELDEFLSDLKMGSLDATVDSLNSKLLINNKKIKIESKPININMNLNVQFDALKFTTSVFTVASSATKQDGNSRIANSTNALVTARDNFRAGR